MIRFLFDGSEYKLRNGRITKSDKIMKLISESFDFIKTGPEIPDRDFYLFNVKLKPLGAEMIENVPERTRIFTGEIN